MGGVRTTFAGEYSISTFTDEAGAPPRTQFVATVIWRSVGASGMQELPMGVIQRAILRLGFALMARPRLKWLGMAFLKSITFVTMFRFKAQYVLLRLAPRAMRGRIAERILRPEFDPGWASSSSGEGKNKREVKLSKKKGIVRIRDRDFRLPADDRTLVLLVEDDEMKPGGIDVVERSVHIAPIDLPAIDPTAAKEFQEASHRARRSAEGQAWKRAMDDDPIIAAFFARSATRGYDVPRLGP